MKKLFLFLILFFFSAQGFAAGCPDGSESAKFIFQCENDYLTAVKVKGLFKQKSIELWFF